jgi:hypothetical protein
VELRRRWDICGPRGIISAKEMTENVVAKLHDNVGMSQGRTAVREILEAEKAKKMEAAGLVPVNVHVSEMTVKNYMSAIALRPDVTVSTTVLAKANRQHIADTLS